MNGSTRSDRTYKKELSVELHAKCQEYITDDSELGGNHAKSKLVEKAIKHLLGLSPNTEPEWLVQEKDEQIGLLKERVESLERIISNHEQESRERRRLELMDKVALANATRSWWQKLTNSEPDEVKALKEEIIQLTPEPDQMLVGTYFRITIFLVSV